MISIRKLVRGRLWRGIVALATGTSNAARTTSQPVQKSKRTTITVETERVLVMRSERKSVKATE